ncbi:ankyrin [Patellaria atrata CBS 101060]|uniref:Ankyrin n=1 Tax=Patellaria atrata CBS 101060 TaxID=1346257 RepID=A0A9P4S6C1_9PEZI|nr:ankyrin [Patellaria atrata CBS 101060]
MALLEFLLANGGTPDWTDEDGWQPLHYAARAEDIRSSRILLEAGPTPFDLDFGDGVIEQAIKSNRPESIVAIFDSTFYPQRSLVRTRRLKSFELTPIQFAAGSTNCYIIELLLQRGGHPNENPAYYGGRTALQEAAEKGRMAMISLLLNADAE